MLLSPGDSCTVCGETLDGRPVVCTDEFLTAYRCSPMHRECFEQWPERGVYEQQLAAEQQSEEGPRREQVARSHAAARGRRAALRKQQRDTLRAVFVMKLRGMPCPHCHHLSSWHRLVMPLSRSFFLVCPRCGRSFTAAERASMT